jgi:Dolichyl-phosphate-mannose-protein mannosyltransferase
MKKRPSAPGNAARDSRRIRVLALAIFSASLLVRIFFWLATPDRAWAWTAYFKGDAPLWIEWARAIDLGVPFELGLPIHPPGAAYLASLLWTGHASGLGFLRFAWILLGALVPLFVFLAAARSFRPAVAAFAGCWTALSSGLLVLSTSINSETPYLVLAAGALWFTEDLRGRPKATRLAIWSALNGLACLFRVEHALFFVLALAFFTIVWVRRGGLRSVRLAFAALLFFALPLVPWHVTAWSAVRRFNEEPRRLTPVEEHAVAGVETQLAGIPWTPDAARERDRLPAFLRRTASAFVLATVAYRSGREVRAKDFEILEEAFGYRPRPLRAHPFVSSYGPLNFALANNELATAGFDRSPLDAPPPLAGGESRYPAFLVQGLPPPRLTFLYPPHLELFNDGYAIGANWIAQHPREFARLARRKLAIFWSGAASGLTGWNFPIGLSGPRPAVDMVAAGGGAVASVWRLLVLVAAAAGLIVGRRRPELVPWLLFLASRIAVTILFFGYARIGVTAIPVVAVLIGFAASRGIPVRQTATAMALLAAGLAAEGSRVVAKPEVTIDGRAVVASADPFPADEHDPHRVEVRY